MWPGRKLARWPWRRQRWRRAVREIQGDYPDNRTLLACPLDNRAGPTFGAENTRPKELGKWKRMETGSGTFAWQAEHAGQARS